MSPDHHHSLNATWQKSRAIQDTAHLRNSVSGENTKRPSVVSNSSSSSSSDLLTTRRSSNSEFLNKIKYFERKTDPVQVESQQTQPSRIETAKKSSLRKVINDVRAQFLENDWEIDKKTNATSTKHNYNSPRVSYVQNKGLPPEAKKTENTEDPAKPLALKKTTNDAKEAFTKGNVDITIPTGFSYCELFFSTSNNDCILKEISADKQFRIILKGSLYSNIYPGEVIEHHMRYHIHDFFDYDLSPFEFD